MNTNDRAFWGRTFGVFAVRYVVTALDEVGRFLRCLLLPRQQEARCRQKPIYLLVLLMREQQLLGQKPVLGER
jgi:hypothetical protein